MIYEFRRVKLLHSLSTNANHTVQCGLFIFLWGAFWLQRRSVSHRPLLFILFVVDRTRRWMSGSRQARFAIRNLGMFHSFSHAQVAGRYYNPSHSTRKNCVIKGAGGKGTQVNRSLFSLCYSSGCGPLSSPLPPTDPAITSIYYVNPHLS